MSTAENNWTDETGSIDHAVLRDGITFEESQKMYEKWGQKGDYDEVIGDPKNYQALKAIQEAVQSVVSNRDALFLDVGAGTGLTAEALKEVGYHNFHALEPVASFCETAESKGIYSKIIQQFIGNGQPAEVPNDTYDVLVSTGAFGPGHIPSSAILDMIRIVKPGGYIIHCMREEFLSIVPDYRDNMVPLMEQLVKEGKWKLVSHLTYQNHFIGKNGVKLIYKVC